MTQRQALAVIACLLIGACSRPAPDADRNAPAPAATAAAAPAVPAPKLAGCSDKIQIVLDRPSLIDTGGKPFPAARMAAFEGKVGSAFHGAAGEACKTPSVRGALAPVRRIVVQSGSGAADPTFFRLNEHKGDAIVFQWTFNEAALGVPERTDIELGLRCWADPDRKECADMGD